MIAFERNNGASRHRWRQRYPSGGEIKTVKSEEFFELPEEAMALLVDERQKEIVSLSKIASLLRFAKRYKGEYREDFCDTVLSLLYKITKERTCPGLSESGFLC